MRLGRNVLAGIVSSVWTALLGLGVVPLYLRYLGTEAYGLIGFFATTQALLQVLDFGLAPTVNREVARCAAAGDLREAGRLLHTLAVVSWTTALVIGVAFAAASPAVARGWLQVGHLSAGTVTQALAIMGLIIAFRWPVGLYLGALMGAERLTLAAALSIAMVTLANGGAVVVLAFWSPTLPAFFFWQAGVGLVHALAVRWAAWHAVGRTPGLRFDRGELRRVWRFSAGMSGIAIFGLAFTQLDKVILSRVLPLEEFGRYMVASTVAAGLYLLATPLFNAVYPRFCALVARGEHDALASLYRQGTRLLGSVLFPLAALLFFSGEDLVRVWTGNAELAARAAALVGLLTMGSALHGVMYFPYALQLAHGSTKLALQISTVLAVIMLPLILGLALSYGALGGAIAWVTLQVLYVAVGTWMTHRELLRGLGPAWLLKDVGIPLSISLLVGIAGQMVLRLTALAIWPRLVAGAGLALVAAALCLAVSPGLMVALRDNLRRELGAPPEQEARN